MPIFSIAPLTPLTSPTLVNRGESSADALARAAIVQTTETLGAMIGQNHSEVANPGLKDAVGEGDLDRARAAEARAAANLAAASDAPARAVSVAAGRAAARQGGLAPLMADMTQAAADPGVPTPVKAAIAQVMALGARMDGQISGPEIRQALQRSGLFLEARLAVAAPEDAFQRQRAGALTAPPRVLPAPTPNSDMKAALLVFREVVKTWVDALPPTSVQAAPSAPNPAATAAAQQAERGTPQALAPTPAPQSATPAAAALDPEALDAGRPPPVAADVAETPDLRPAWQRAMTSPPVARPEVREPLLPTFGAIVADDFAQPLEPPLATPRAMQAVLAGVYGAPAAHAAAGVPPPYPGAPTHAQAAAQSSLPLGADPHLIGQRLLTESGAALARTELLQIASLPEPLAVGRPADDPGARWVFDMPFQTPQGPAVAQFEISRDGGGSGGEGGRTTGRTWRARFSLDVEPMGPVHAQVALTGDRARVSLWAERPASMARLRGGEARLDAALREAALEPEVAFHAGQPRTVAAAPGQFLDRAT